MNSQISLIVAGDGSEAFLRSGGEQAMLASRRELFSFGSGVWSDGADATQAMSDAAGSWLQCRMNFSSMVILERKKIPQHLGEMACLDKPGALKDLLMALEDQGEASWQNMSGRSNLNQNDTIRIHSSEIILFKSIFGAR